MKITINRSPPKAFDQLAKRLFVIGNPTRLRILCLLFQAKNLCVSDVAKELNISIAITSHHLQALTNEGILVYTRNGKKICYTLAQSLFMKDLKKLICTYK